MLYLNNYLWIFTPSARNNKLFPVTPVDEIPSRWCSNILLRTVLLEEACDGGPKAVKTISGVNNLDPRKLLHPNL